MSVVFESIFTAYIGFEIEFPKSSFTVIPKSTAFPGITARISLYSLNAEGKDAIMSLFISPSKLNCAKTSIIASSVALVYVLLQGTVDDRNIDFPLEPFPLFFTLFWWK